METKEKPAGRVAGSRTGAGPSEQRRFSLLKRWLKKPQALPYLLVIPAILFELFIHIVPMLFGVMVSFFGLTQFYVRNWSAAPFVGLKNFAAGLNPAGPIGSALFQSFLVTALFTVLVVGGSWVLGMCAALIVNGELRGRRWFRTLFLVPYATPAFVTVIAWQFILQKDTGALNKLLVDDLGLLRENPFWLIGDNAFWSVVMISLWGSWPFAFLMLLAGLQSISSELYEAAAIDGASKLRQFWSITLPMLRPVNLVLLLVLFLWRFNEFNTPYILFGQAPPASADLLSLHIYVSSFVNWNFGLGAAMSVLLLLFLLVVSVIYIRALRVGGEENA
jgi:multiple sugar transport system permease protein